MTQPGDGQLQERENTSTAAAAVDEDLNLLQPATAAETNVPSFPAESDTHMSGWLPILVYNN